MENIILTPDENSNLEIAYAKIEELNEIITSLKNAMIRGTDLYEALNIDGMSITTQRNIAVKFLEDLISGQGANISEISDFLSLVKKMRLNEKWD